MALCLRISLAYLLIMHSADAARVPAASQLEEDGQLKQLEHDNMTASIPPQFTTCDGNRDDCSRWLGLKSGCSEDRICCNCRKTRAAYTTTSRVCHPSPAIPCRNVVNRYSRYDSGYVAKCARVSLFPTCEGTKQKP